MGCIKLDQPELEAFNGNIGHNQPALFTWKNNVYICIKAASNKQRDPSAIAEKTAKSFSSTRQSAAQMKIFSCSDNHSEGQEFSKQARTLAWIPQSPHINRVMV